MSKKKKGFFDKVGDFLSGLFGKKGKKKKTTHKKKSPSKKKAGKKKENEFFAWVKKVWNSVFGRKSDVRKIYKTTDGYFTQNPKAKKPRRIAVIKQRKDDGALAVCKIYSKGEKEGSRFIQGLTLSPDKHKSLTEDSIVGGNVIVGTKDKNGEYKPIYKGDLELTKDKLTKQEHQHILDNLGGGVEKYKKTNEELLEKWGKHFKSDDK